MAKKPTYEELEQRVKGLENKLAERKQSEEALEESEKRYRAVFQGAVEGILIADIKTRKFEYANPALCRMLGYTEEELKQLSVLDIHPKEDLEHVLSEFEAQTQGKKILAPRIPCVRKDGTTMYADVCTSPITIDGRECNLGFFTDVTEREKAEEELQESEARYNALFSGITDAVWVHRVTPDGRPGNLIEVNDTACKMLGYSNEELLSMEIADIDAPESDVDVEHIIEELKAGRDVLFEQTHVKKDGTRVPVEVHTQTFDYRGKLAVLSTVRDITERKQMESRLRFQAMLLDQIGENVTATDLSGRIIYVNEAGCRLMGRRREELIGQPTEAYGEDTKIGPTQHELLEKTLKQGKWKGVVANYDAEGKKVLMEVNTQAVLNERNERIGLIGVARDITERVQAEEEKERLEAQLLQAQKMEAMGTLAGGIAHDFNNLLMGILGNASLMLAKMESANPDYEKLKTIEKLVRSGSNLTRQLLGYARKGRYVVKPINLNHLLEETTETFWRTRKEISIHQDLAEDLFAVEAEEGQIEQVLFNLYVNAADAMLSGGNLILRTRNSTHEAMKGKVYQPKTGNYVMLEVADTGVGMDKETVNRIFDPFFTTKEMGRGTGLGLASAYGIIKGHGGYIEADSEEGKGTTFTVYLPATEKRVEKKVVTTTEQIVRGSETILLVDDEELIRDVGALMLPEIGYKVLLARSGEKAIKIYKEKKEEIDLVILDMVMPGMGGGETYDKLNEVDPEVKVLLSSGYSIDGKAQEILDRGCNGFIQKPFDMEKLSQKTREILDKK